MRRKPPPWVFTEPPSLHELELARRRARLHEICYTTLAAVMVLWLVYVILTTW